jgi:uncharacterized protein (DUF697 family)
MLLVDLPGYDTKKFPKNEFFTKFQVESFDVFLCVSDGKMRAADSEFWAELHSRGKVCLYVRNKKDAIKQTGKTFDELAAEIRADVRRHTGNAATVVHFVECIEGDGLGELEEAIYQSLEPAKRERFARAAAAHSARFLELKREACEKYVWSCAGIAAANALNPIPGVDIAVDLSTLAALFVEVRKEFGLSDTKLTAAEGVPALAPLAREVVAFTTREGIMILLKKYGGRQALKQFGKYVPLVGQALAASVGFGLTKAAGDHYVGVCYKLAKAFLDSELEGG